MSHGLTSGLLLDDPRGRYAFITVDRKTPGLLAFARSLSELGISLVSSGGTAKFLHDGGVPVMLLSDILFRGKNLTPEEIERLLLRHKVVSLSREACAGYLADPNELDIVEEIGGVYFSIVCVGLYDLHGAIRDAYSQNEPSPEAVRAKTDVGGVTAAHGAAKGRRCVVVEEGQYVPVINWIKDGCPNPELVCPVLAERAETAVRQHLEASERFLFAYVAQQWAVARDLPASVFALSPYKTV